MSFSLEQIKKSKNRGNYSRINTRQCFAVLDDIPVITINIKKALIKYVEYRLKVKRTPDFSPYKLFELVQELLEKCCDKSYNILSINDIMINEKAILKQIKNAVLSGMTKHIYKEQNDNIVNTSTLRTTILPYNRKLNKNTNKDADLIMKYFEDMRI